MNEPHPDCPRGYEDHEPHYLGRNLMGIPQRCEGYEEDPGEYLGWTGL